MNKAAVKCFDAGKGFAFITPEDGRNDFIVHHSAINSGDSYATLSEGQLVEYKVAQGQKGACTNNVVLAKLH